MERTECLKQFIKAATDARNGEYGRAKALVDTIRREDGDREANAMRQEIWRFANMSEEEWTRSTEEIEEET